jgi:lysozyme
MGKIKLFEDFLNEAVQASAETIAIADRIQKAVGGLGTDEGMLTQAVSSIPNVKTLVRINQIMSEDPKYSYKTVGDAIDGELGFFDDNSKATIDLYIGKIKGKDYLKSITDVPTPAPVVKPKAIPEKPKTPVEEIIKAIVPRIKKHEGVRPKKYTDSRGVPTVGVGFNLRRPDADKKLKSVGANPIKVKQGKQALSEYQIDSLLMGDLKTANQSASELVTNISVHPDFIQGVLTEMAFNLGKKGLGEFKNFLGLINAKKYSEASKEMLRSAWSKQVGKRAQTLAGIISSKPVA